MVNLYFMTIQFISAEEAQKGADHLGEDGAELDGRFLRIGLGDECLSADFKYAQLLSDLDDQGIQWESASDE